MTIDTDCTEPAPSAGVSGERVRELQEWFARPADAGLAWNNTMRRRDDVAAICTELLSARSRIAELEAGARNALQQLDDDPEYSALRADIRALLPKEST